MAVEEDGRLVFAPVSTRRPDVVEVAVGGDAVSFEVLKY